MFQRAFVTGGSGFVGHHLIRELCAQGTEVRALARSEQAADVVRQAGATPVIGELANKDILQQGMANCDVIFHLAALTNMWGNFDEYYQVNVVGTEHVIAAARAAGVPKLVYISTEAVLTGSQPIVNADEARPRSAHPLGVYAKTKAMAEERVIAANSSQLTTVIVRPRLIWGPEDTANLPQLVTAAQEGKFAFIDGGHFLTSTTHVTNVCEGLLLAAEKGRGGEIYFISDGAPVEFRTFITALLQTAGVDPGNKSIPRGLAKTVARIAEFSWKAFKLKGSPPVTSAAVQLIGEEVTVNDAKARQELGYVGKVSREEGLAAMRSAQQPATSASTAGGV